MTIIFSENKRLKTNVTYIIGISFKKGDLGVCFIYFCLCCFFLLTSQRVEGRPRMACPFSVVVAIDFGTTSSGYAFSFTHDSEAIHMMK